MPGISVNPDPMVAGQSADVCYDFTGLGGSTVTLEITWSPSGCTSPNPQTITVTKDAGSNSGCTQVDVPSGADGVQIEDQTYGTESYSKLVEPPPPGGI